MTGPSSRLEADLRRADRRDRRPRHGKRRLREGPAVGDRRRSKRAGVDSVKLETYPAPGEVGGDLRVRVGGRAGGFPLRVVSFGLAPSTPGPVTAAARRRGCRDDGRLRAARRRSREGAIALVRSSAMKSFDDLFAEYLARARDDAGGRRRTDRRRSCSCRRGPATCSTGTRSPGGRSRRSRWRRSRREDGLRLGAAPRGGRGA